MRSEGTKNKSTGLNQLRLLTILFRGEKVAISDLAKWLNLSERSVYRCLENLKSESPHYYQMILNEGNFYWIPAELGGDQDQFSAEEIEDLKIKLSNQDGDNAIHKLLRLMIRHDSVSTNKPKLKKSEINEKEIAKAIKEGKFMNICYNSRSNRDSALRIIFPVFYDVSSSLCYAWQWDEGKREYSKKCFANDNRIINAFKVDTTYPNCPKWNLGIKDPFGFVPMKNEKLVTLKIRLSGFAKGMLLKQFPHLTKYIKTQTTADVGFPFLLSIDVYDIQPIARFCVGFLHQVSILSDRKSEVGAEMIKNYFKNEIANGYKRNFNENVGFNK